MEKTLTFTVEDALLSPIGFAVLSGAGLFDAENENYQVHCTAVAFVDSEGKIELEDTVSAKAPVFVMVMEDGSLGELISGVTVEDKTLTVAETYANKQVFVDYYVNKTKGVTELQIDAENFAGYYYVEASTLFRRESDGKDLPAEIIFPRVKIQSNFTFTMSSTGDPSTFAFTMDAFPAYTMFNKEKKVLCAMQIIDDAVSGEDSVSVTTLEENETVEEIENDSRKSAAE